MKTYFVCSDIHGFYKEWMKSLKAARYDKENIDHILIVLGDLFDRGQEPYKIYKFLRSIPEDRLILIKGNHESLLLELVKRKQPFSDDYSNGTYGTLISLYKDPRIVEWEYIRKHAGEDRHDLLIKANGIFRKANDKLYNNKKLNEIIEWINSPIWKDYYELGRYIFVHSFIPLLSYGNNIKMMKYDPDWRTSSTEMMWENARWGCPYEYYLEGYFDEELKKGKILVCGHWHTSDFYNKLLYKNNPEKQLNIKTDNPIFKSDKYPGLIGIDACTALTKTVNILVIKEDEI